MIKKFIRNRILKLEARKVRVMEVSMFPGTFLHRKIVLYVEMLNLKIEILNAIIKE